MAGGYLGNIYNTQHRNSNNNLLLNDTFENITTATISNKKMTTMNNIINNPAIGALIGFFSVILFFLALFGLYKFIDYMRH